MINTRKEKLKIISELFEKLLQDDPNRSLEWYGQKFDELYDKSNWHLTTFYNFLLLKSAKKELMKDEKN